MNAQLQRFNINFRRSIPAEANLVQAANEAAMPAAVYLRGAALAGHALLAAGCRLLEDGSLLVPGPSGALVQLRPAEIIAVARRRDILQGGEEDPVRPSGQAAPRAPEPAPAPAPVVSGPEPAPVPRPSLPHPAPSKAEATTTDSQEEREAGAGSEQDEIAQTALRSLGLNLG